MSCDELKGRYEQLLEEHRALQELLALKEGRGMEKRFVVIAGNIGVGKTTLTRLLADKLGWRGFYEEFEQNPYLERFYEDMRAWAFDVQVWFLFNRTLVHLAICDSEESVAQDRSIYEDGEIFARNLMEMGLMEKKDYRRYRRLYEMAVDKLPAPDLLIYLKASVPTLMKRIRGRGRGMEAEITVDYLKRLDKLYEKWMRGFKLCPVWTIQTDGLNLVENGEHRECILEGMVQWLEV